jgi:hypothetical protein
MKFVFFLVLLFLIHTSARWSWRTSRCYEQLRTPPQNFAGLQHTGETYLELVNFPEEGETYIQNQFFFYYETAGECLDLANYTINRVTRATFVEKDARENASPSSWSTRYEVLYYTYMGHSEESNDKVRALCPNLPDVQVNIPLIINDTECLASIFDGARVCPAGQFEWNTLEFVDDFNMNYGQWGGLVCSDSETEPSYPVSAQSTFWVNIFSNTPFPTPTATSMTPTTTVIPRPPAQVPFAAGTYAHVQCTPALELEGVGRLYFNTEIRIAAWTLPIYQTVYWYINQCVGPALWTTQASYQPFVIGFTADNETDAVIKMIPLRRTLTAAATNVANLIRMQCVKLPVLQSRPFDVSNIDCFEIGIYSKTSCPVTHNTVRNNGNNLIFGSHFPICSKREVNSTIFIPNGNIEFTRLPLLGFKK